MAKSARFSCVLKPLCFPATITMGTFAVDGCAFNAVISSLPLILGICMSVTIRSGCTRLSISSASCPLVADSTAKPRSSRKRQTVWRMSMESSTTNAVRFLVADFSNVCTLMGQTSKTVQRPTRGKAGHDITSVTPVGGFRCRESGFVAEVGVFDRHVFEFAGLKDFAAFHALDEFCVLFARDNLYARMLTGLDISSRLRGLRRRDWRHKSGMALVKYVNHATRVGNLAVF